MKKFLALVFAAVMAMAMLAGCGGTDTPASQGAGASTPAASAGDPSQAGETLEYVKLEWYLLTPLDPRPSEEAVMAEVNRRLLEDLNCEIEFKFMDAVTYVDKMNVMAASGDAFDIAFMNNGLGFSTLAAKGAFYPIDELLDSYGQGILGKVDEPVWSAVTYGGQRMAVINPAAWSITQAIYYKADLAEKYDLDMSTIHSLQDLEPYLQTIKENEPTITPLCVARNGAPAYGSYAYADSVTTVGISYNVETDELYYFWEDPDDFKDARTLREYVEKGYVRADASTKENWTDEFRTGMYAVAGYAGTVYDKTFQKSSNSYGFPCWESPWKLNPVNTSMVQSAMTVIGKNCKDPERAMMVIDKMFSDIDFFNTVCYGLEGQDYDVISGAGTDEPTLEVHTPNTWNIPHPWVGSLYDQWPSNWNTKESLEQLENDSNNGERSKLLGFTFDASPVETQVAQLNAIMPETYDLMTGSIADIDGFVAGIKDRMIAAGIEEVRAELEKQIAAWEAENG